MANAAKHPELFAGLPIGEGSLIPTDRTLPPVPLKHTTIRVQIIGPICDVQVEQLFHNTHTAPIEALYVFPLPEDAAVSALTLTIGERTISGEVREREQARKEYQQARDQGQGAALLEQQRPNLFSVAVANIQPNEQVRVALRFHDRLSLDDGRYELVLPTVVMPRYTPPGQEADAPPSPALLPADTRDGHTLSVEVLIDAGKIEEITSPSHAIQVEQRRGGQAVVTLQPSEKFPNKDVILRYRAAGNQPEAAAFTYREANRPGVLLLTLTPQLDVVPGDVLPRDLIFVFDRSGSMGGTSIEQARNALRACLRALNPADTFNIVAFDDRVEFFRPVSQPFTQQSIDAADQYITTIDARGGTEILAALQGALALPASTERLRVIVFLTDGGVSNEDQVLRELHQALGSARVFAFGVGPAVNRYLLDKLAEVGRGSVEYVFPGQEIEDAVQRFQSRAALPLLTDLTLDWGGAQVLDLYPDPLPDLYASQPISLLARFLSSGTTRVTVSGTTRQGPFRQTLSVEWPASTPDRGESWRALPQVWARARIDALQNRQRASAGQSSQVRDEILSLALEHRLLSPYTSFVAVEQLRPDHAGRERAEPVVVPIYLPEGLQREAFEGQPVPAAPPAALRMAAPTSFSPPSARTRAGSSGLFKRTFESLGFGGSANAPDTGSLSPADADMLMAAPAPMAPEAEERVRGITLPDNRSSGQRTEAALRYLGRTQAVSGAWAESPLATALALLAFVRAGHTDRKGSFRPQLTRSVAWLSSQAQQPAAHPVLAWALAELAAETGAAAHISARDAALANASRATPIEAACAALAERATGRTVADVALSGTPRSAEEAVLQRLLNALHDNAARTTLAQEFAARQGSRDATDGAVAAYDARSFTPDAALFATTAIGAIVWGG